MTNPIGSSLTKTRDYGECEAVSLEGSTVAVECELSEYRLF